MESLVDIKTCFRNELSTWWIYLWAIIIGDRVKIYLSYVHDDVCWIPPESHKVRPLLAMLSASLFASVHSRSCGGRRKSYLLLVRRIGPRSYLVRWYSWPGGVWSHRVRPGKVPRYRLWGLNPGTRRESHRTWIRRCRLIYVDMEAYIVHVRTFLGLKLIRIAVVSLDMKYAWSRPLT